VEGGGVEDRGYTPEFERTRSLAEGGRGGHDPVFKPTWAMDGAEALEIGKGTVSVSTGDGTGLGRFRGAVPVARCAPFWQGCC